MARKDYLPANESELSTWNINYQTKIAAFGAELGLTPAEITELQEAAEKINRELTAVDQKEREYRQAVSKKEAAKKESLGIIRTANERIKKSKAFTEDIGKVLGIIGSESSASSQPLLKKAEATPQGVALYFQRQGYAAVNVYRTKIGAAPGYEKIGVAITSPFTDNSFAAGEAGTYEYKIIGVEKNTETGLFSEPVTVVFAS
jgi:hypothetical protein